MKVMNRNVYSTIKHIFEFLYTLHILVYLVSATLSSRTTRISPFFGLYAHVYLSIFLWLLIAVLTACSFCWISDIFIIFFRDGLGRCGPYKGEVCSKYLTGKQRSMVFDYSYSPQSVVERQLLREFKKIKTSKLFSDR